MEAREFKVLLHQIGLSKKDFAQLVGLSYDTIKVWGARNPVPSWVRSYIENYIKAKKYDELMEKIREKS